MSSSPPLSPSVSKDDSQPFQITLDKPVIASPFPSPGSAFIPPPIPIVHEFTLPSKRGKKGNNTSPGSGSGTSTPNNGSSSSLVQSNHNSYNERNTDSSLSFTQPQTSSISQPKSPVLSKVTNSDNADMDSTSPDEEFSTQLFSSSSSGNNTFSGSGRDTPTPSNTTGNVNVTPRTPSPSSNGNAAANVNVNQRTSMSASSTTSSRPSSLSSSRPAPPSPALSRNTSQSRGGSRRQSRLSLGASPNGNCNNTANGTATPSKRLSVLSTLSAPSNASANKRLSTLSNISTLPTVPQFQVASAVTPTKAASNIKPSGQIVIRDFAFVLTDNRHTGQGPDTPKVVKKMQKRYGPAGIRKPGKGHDSASASASSSCASSESESRRGSGFGFGWGTNAGAGFGGWWSGMWSGFGSGSRTSRAEKRENDENAYTPTANDLSMNFNTSSSPTISQPSSPAVTPQVISSHIDEDDNANQLLLPGLYKALYDFTPEGTAEMGLRQGDIVRVAGRGGGEGWAVVARGTVRFTDEGDEVIEFDGENAEVRSDEAWALVPESYLELWSLDRNDEEDQYADDEE
ncbi:hypothetical protein Clacol_010527 [Clathrus columnatus]|uniref:SH3 domain-containing protein n=1 Tax=Clathrus columnatus TaxID=1419009 RepID=A0AAV5ANK1_9AGAM|nr:hypothetical protein Clacol_010527 [Clathrus columnatus]